ncbi:MAG: DUF5703 domain-containing protein [Armatimonadetes bacterium]|nr:DUF5703 domain-containing protein [Armatimonadota bacterium]MDW8121036.1 DUF5703 domain-containing protein [Armatimonadota bacterium]
MGLMGLLLVATLLVLLSASPGWSDFPTLDNFNVVWETPSQDALGSMPLGNGDITLNVWVEEDKDLLFYIGKSDSWDEFNRLLKVGKVRFSLSSNPFKRGENFRQELVLRRGEILITAGGVHSPAVTCRLWVDAHLPVITVTIDSRRPISVTTSLELWRTTPTIITSSESSDIYLDCPNPPQLVLKPDTIAEEVTEGLCWFHFNGKSEAADVTMALQDLTDAPWHDPLDDRIFGGLVLAHGPATKINQTQMTTPLGNRHRFSICILTQQPSSPEKWLSDIRSLAKKIAKMDCQKRRRDHIRWWDAFWKRSWILIRDREVELSSPVPSNSHPLRIGVDQAGGSIFRGDIARASVLRGSLSPNQIQDLFKGPKKVLAGSRVAVSRIRPKTGTILNADLEKLSSFTCEAWVRVKDDDAGGRIFDKITPGGSDGFLLDTYPGKSVRLIVGSRTLLVKDVLQPDTWHHIAAVIAQGKLQIYLDGRWLAGDENPAGYDVCRAYILQRFITACAGRGAYPIKFNGSTFVMPYPGQPYDADYRRWGPGYWWQNTRLPYYSAATSGDFDILQPFFKMYAGEVFEVCRYRTRHYFGFDGAYFPECIYPWGAVFPATYGWEPPAAERQDKLQTSGWHKYEWVGGLELAFLMLDYYEHTLDETFLKKRAVPLAIEVLKFFNNFYRTGSDGRLVMEPSQALETWWECLNPMPEVAGLHAITQRLLSLPPRILAKEQRVFLEEFQRKIPPLPVRQMNGLTLLAPAERFAKEANVENPELYAVFPFRLVSFEKENAPLGINALHHRRHRGNFGWRQDDIFMAYLGVADQARDYIVGRARNKDPLCRFPAFWGPNYDWTPDQDHGGVLMKALQAMLLQTEGKKIFLFPAWPRNWDVSFRLHAPYRTVLEGKLVNGRLVSLRVTPPSRRQDVTILKPQ